MKWKFHHFLIRAEELGLCIEGNILLLKEILFGKMIRQWIQTLKYHGAEIKYRGFRAQWGMRWGYVRFENVC